MYLLPSIVIQANTKKIDPLNKSLISLLKPKRKLKGVEVVFFEVDKKLSFYEMLFYNQKLKIMASIHCKYFRIATYQNLILFLFRTITSQTKSRQRQIRRYWKKIPGKRKNWSYFTVLITSIGTIRSIWKWQIHGLFGKYKLYNRCLEMIKNLQDELIGSFSLPHF